MLKLRPSDQSLKRKLGNISFSAQSFHRILTKQSFNRHFSTKSIKPSQYSGQRAQNAPNKDQTLISPISYSRNQLILPMTYCRNPKISPIPAVAHGGKDRLENLRKFIQFSEDRLLLVTIQRKPIQKKSLNFPFKLVKNDLLATPAMTLSRLRCYNKL